MNSGDGIFKNKECMDDLLIDPSLVLNKAFEATGDAIGVADISGKHLYHNQSYSDMFGYTVEEMKQINPKRHYADKEVADEVFASIMTGGSWIGEVEMISRDGKKLFIHLRADAIKDENGSVIGLIKVHRDVTREKIIDVKNKEISSQLHERIKELKSLYHISDIAEQREVSISSRLTDICDLIKEAWQYPDLTCVRITVAHSIDHVSTHYRDQWHLYTTSNFLETPWCQSADIKFKNSAMGKIEVFYLEELPEIYEGPFLKEERALINAISSHLGKVLSNKLLTDSIESERRRLLALLDGIDDVIYVSDPETYDLLHINDRFSNTWGKDISGKKCYEVLQGRSEPCPFCTNDRIFGENKGQTYVWEFQNEVDRRWYRCSDKAIQWVDGRWVRFELASDITPLKKMEQDLEELVKQLQASNGELERFAYVASHDLQEPLRKVTSFSDLLAKKYSGQLDEKAERYISYITDGTVRMQNLINDILTYSRVTTKAKPMEEVSLMSLLYDIEDTIELYVKKNNATLEYKELPDVYADPIQMKQLFTNLITNAVKFHGDDDPKVTISSCKEAGRWVIGVSDNGIGMESQYLDRIFTVFQRLHTRDKYEGTGIGLSICKKIVERHGGDIWVESEPGKGSTFYFSLPDTTAKNRVQSDRI